jgi:hypothetical protein
MTECRRTASVPGQGVLVTSRLSHQPELSDQLPLTGLSKYEIIQFAT